MAVLACAGRAEQRADDPELEPAIVEGLGRVCVVGSVSRLHLQAYARDGAIVTPTSTGERTCSDLGPGLALVITQSEGHKAQVALAWVDVGETTTIELGPPLRLGATAPSTEALANIVAAGSCAWPNQGCSAARVAADVERLQSATSSASVRERQAARFALLGVYEAIPDLASLDEQRQLMNQVWDELDEAPLVAASFPSVVVMIVDDRGPEARDELEQMASEATGAGAQWSAHIRGFMLAHLIETAGGDEAADATRTRLRAVVRADPKLRESMWGAKIISETPLAAHMLERAELLARDVVEELAPRPCEQASRWLIYFHLSTCGACKRATERVGGLLDSRSEDLRVVTVPLDSELPAFADRPNVATSTLSPALEGWFVETRGGVVAPYFIGLQCGESAELQLVGLGSFDEATKWTSPATPASPESQG